jgi:hypothetical protein
MRNKNRVFRIAALLLVLSLISAVMISGTFAKYTSEYSGQDTALVARWSLDVKGGGEKFADGTENPATLDLFSHLYNVNIVEDAGTDKIIAPGVDGEFVLSVTNNSDVAAGVEFGFEATGAEVPMEYSLDSDFSTLYTTLNGETSSLAAAINTPSEGTSVFAALPAAPLMGDPTTKTLTVYWRWPFERDTGDDLITNDKADTALGEDSAEGSSRIGYTLKITATATQLPPEGPEPEP